MHETSATHFKESTDNKGNIQFRNDSGQLHRTDGPALIWATGSRFWFQHGQLHREDGPAIEWETGATDWFLNGVHHRINGPAIERPDGAKRYYLFGKLSTRECVEHLTGLEC